MITFPSFAQFFREVHGADPYPWQEALAHRVAEYGWPNIVDIPTGLGKTASVDVAVYELARQVHIGGRRTAPQRVFHVVERRLVVDQVHSHVAALAEALNGTPSPESACGRVSTELRRLTGDGMDGDAIVVDSVHGQRRDDRDLLRSTGCMVVALTAHQFVSRLMFRGFGISEKTRSVYAGLVGIDRLVLFDEPQLAIPAIDAIRDAERVQRRAREDLGVPIGSTVLLGATVPPSVVDGSTSRHTLGSDDLANDRVVERIEAPRPLCLEKIATASDAVFAKALARTAVDLVRRGDELRRVWVAVNTVGLARDVSALIRKMRGGLNTPVRTLTSRMRPFDRDRPSDESGRIDAPGITVATQCLEVGVDVSFDVVVTEPCPYASLTQRLGRLNRYGATADAMGVMVVPQGTGGERPVRKGSAAVYGESPVASMVSLLDELAVDDVVDMSLSAQRRVFSSERTADLWPAPPRSATLTTGLVPLMTTTRPTPVGDFPVPAYVVGPDESTGAAEVLVAWRVSLEHLDVCPPTRPEQVAVPVGSLVEHLSGIKASGLDDTGASSIDVPRRSLSEVDIRVRKDGEWVTPSRPGDLVDGDSVVLASGVGGYGIDGWAPGEAGPVSDISFEVALSAEAGEKASFVVPLSEAPCPERIAELAAEVRELPGDEDSEVRNLLVDRLHVDVVLGDLGNALLVTVGATHLERPKPHLVPTLVAHREQVGAMARADARAAGLRDDLVAVVYEAGLRHDDGKAWRPFQESMNVDPDVPMAKSGLRSPVVANRWKDLAGVPRGWRHEALSAELAEKAGCDELTVHLIASHHGWNRPLMPAMDAPSQLRGVSGAAVFADLNERFGPWGLAYLESVVRLADWAASRRPRASALGVIAFVDKAPLEQRPEGLPADSLTHELTGLRASPMAGWYCMAALAWAANDMGDHDARIRWQASGSDSQPGTPMLATRFGLREVVEHICTLSQWDEGLALLDRYGIELGVKNQKVSANTVRSALLDADQERLWFVLGLVGDAGAAEGANLTKGDRGQVPLPIAPQPINSSYTKVGLRHRGNAAGVALALTDMVAGTTDDNCDGGMDRTVQESPLVSGLGVHGSRKSRGLLAPLVVVGIASLGAGGPRGHGVTGGILNLPAPTMPVTHAELAALSRVAGTKSVGDWSRIGCQWMLRMHRQTLDKTTALWLGGLAQLGK